MNDETMETTAQVVTEPAEAASETIVIVEHRPFMTTPLDDYTVQEGLTLLIFVLLLILVVLDLIHWR